MSTIQQLIAEASGKVGAIGKNKKMEAGPARYAYRSVDDVIAAVHPVFAELGIVMAPQVCSLTYGEMPTKSGGSLRLCTMEVEFYFYGPEADSIMVRTVGEATDSGDKSPNKAHTAAEKVALCQLLMIPFDSQDPDDTPSDTGTPAPRPSSPRSSAPAAASATAEKVCALCDQPITSGQPVTKKQGKFQHKDGCPGAETPVEQVQAAFEGAELVPPGGPDDPERPF